MAAGVYTIGYRGPLTASERAAPDMIAREGSRASDDREQAENRLIVTLDQTQLELVEGDITDLDVDAIVNAANEKLQLGGGRGRGHPRRRAAPRSRRSATASAAPPVGTAVMTGAGHLKAKQVIHAVGPQMGEGDEDRKLASAVRSALALADRHGLKSIALPAISTGNFGFPMDRAARIMLTEIHRYLQGGTKLERVVVCLRDERPSTSSSASCAAASASAHTIPGDARLGDLGAPGRARAAGPRRGAGSGAAAAARGGGSRAPPAEEAGDGARRGAGPGDRARGPGPAGRAASPAAARQRLARAQPAPPRRLLPRRRPRPPRQPPDQQGLLRGPGQVQLHQRRHLGLPALPLLRLPADDPVHRLRRHRVPRHRGLHRATSTACAASCCCSQWPLQLQPPHLPPGRARPASAPTRKALRVRPTGPDQHLPPPRLPARHSGRRPLQRHRRRDPGAQRAAVHRLPRDRAGRLRLHRRADLRLRLRHRRLRLRSRSSSRR